MSFESSNATNSLDENLARGDSEEDSQGLNRSRSSSEQLDVSPEAVEQQRNNWAKKNCMTFIGGPDESPTQAADVDVEGQRVALSGLTLFLNKLRDRYVNPSGGDDDEQNERRKESDPGLLSKEELAQKFEEYKETVNNDMNSVCDSALALTTALGELADQVESYTELLNTSYDKRKEDEARIKELEDKNEEINTQWKDKMDAALEELDMAQQMLADHRATRVKNDRVTPAEGEDDTNRTSVQQYEIEMLEAERNKLRDELAEVMARLSRSDIPLEQELEKKDATIRSLQRDLDDLQQHNEELTAEISNLKSDLEMLERESASLTAENEEKKIEIESLLSHLEQLRAQSARRPVHEGESLEDLEDLGDCMAPEIDEAVSASLSIEEPPAPPKVDVVVSTSQKGKTEIHYHIHHHAHGHTHQHDHQHDHYHQYGILTKSAIRSKEDPSKISIKPVILSMTQGEAVYSNAANSDLKSKIPDTAVTGKKRRVKKNITTTTA